MSKLTWLVLLLVCFASTIGSARQVVEIDRVPLQDSVVDAGPRRLAEMSYVPRRSEPGRGNSYYEPVEERNYHGELLDTPIYDPYAKSYFEMVDGSHGLVQGPLSHEGPNWAEANRLAQRRAFKGVRGRLAIVRSWQTHLFLLNTFRPKTYVWIGLRYSCRERKLHWADGSTMEAGSFQAWDKVWRQDVYACASTQDPAEYMPVAYAPLPTFDWIGKGINKRFYYFFVEYPTGKE